MQGEYDEAAESLTLPPLAVAPGDEVELTLRVADGALMSKRDRRLETCRSMLHAFKLASQVKLELYRAMPQLVANPRALEVYAGEIDRVSEAQLAALRNVLERI